MPPTTPSTPPSAVPSSPSPASQSAVHVLGPEASAIDFERMSRFPEPGWQVPRHVSFSPDGKELYYLQSESKSEQMALFGLDPKTGKSQLIARASDLGADDKPMSREEELRRERQRKRIAGVSDFRLAARAKVMLIPHGGDLFVRDEAGQITRVYGASDPAIDPKLSADGSHIAFVKKGELWMLDVKTKKESALTTGAPAGVTRGLSDYLAQEELDEQSGLFWSPTGEKIAYLEVDEREVDTLPVMGYRGGKADLMDQRYPRTGRKNPKVRAGILNLKSKKTTWLKEPELGDRYLGRFNWSKDGKWLYFQILDRAQRTVRVVRADAESGAVTELWKESSPSWVAFRRIALLEKSPRMIATTARDGHLHLDLRDASTGKLIAPLTRGDWDVTAIEAVDEARAQVFFSGTMSAPLERHLYSVSLEGGDIKKLTDEAGVHDVIVSHDGASFADLHSSHERMPRAEVRSSDGKLVGELPIPDERDEVTRLKLRSPELVSFKNAEGTTLYGTLLRPRVMDPGKRYPVVVMVYGGPGVQTVLDAWAPRLLWQHLADRGFVVFQVDNRGSAGRGPAFEAPIYKKLGEVEIADQLAGLDYLKGLPYTDMARVGIYGHSYGGFMAALALFKAPDRFKVGVSGSPVTDWRLYDSAYTERYMGTPEENPSGYNASDLAKLASNLQGKLFVLHAMMDENVHFENTTHLIEGLIAAEKKFDLLVFPGERHGYRSPVSRKYAMTRVVDYLAENL